MLFTSGHRVEVVSTRIAAHEDFLQELSTLLAPDELERSERFRFREHKDAFTVARGLARVILGSHVGIEPARVQFTYGPYGKPQLAGSAVRFNISHSGGMVTYAVSAGLELGVDIERIRPIEDMELIARRFFSQDEHRGLLEIPSELRGRAFFDCWTRKEAFIKAVGEGLSHPLNSFKVSVRAAEPFDRVRLLTPTGSIDDWSLYDLAPSPDYSAALVVQTADIRIQRSVFEDAASCSRFYMR